MAYYKYWGIVRHSRSQISSHKKASTPRRRLAFFSENLVRSCGYRPALVDPPQQALAILWVFVGADQMLQPLADLRLGLQNIASALLLQQPRCGQLVDDFLQHRIAGKVELPCELVANSMALGIAVEEEQKRHFLERIDLLLLDELNQRVVHCSWFVPLGGELILVVFHHRQYATTRLSDCSNQVNARLGFC